LQKYGTSGPFLKEGKKKENRVGPELDAKLSGGLIEYAIFAHLRGLGTFKKRIGHLPFAPTEEGRGWRRGDCVKPSHD